MVNQHCFELFRLSTYIKTELYVWHIERDDLFDGNLIFSDGNSMKTTDGNTTVTIAGLATKNGYAEGIGAAALFNWVSGFYQLSRRRVLVADRDNHCVRLVDRLTLQTSTYVGECTVRGYTDGLQARLYAPMGVIKNIKEPGSPLIVEWGNGGFRKLKDGSRMVSTFFSGRDSMFGAISGVTQDSVTGDFYLNSVQNIYHMSYNDFTITKLAGSRYGYKDGYFSDAMFANPAGLALMKGTNRQKLLVADSNNMVVRVLDMETNTTSSICVSHKAGHVDGPVDSCSFATAKSLMIDGELLFVGEFGRISTGRTHETMKDRYNCCE